MNGEVIKVQEKVATNEDLELLQNWDGKHPLKNSWVFWYSDKSISTDWLHCLKEVAPFDTVEDFWCLFNFLQPVSQLKVGCDFYLFKKGIRPMWEDPFNKNGGRWDIPMEKHSRQDIDRYWMELVMLVVGEENFAIANIVNGVCVNRRDKFTRISVWVNVASDRAKIISVGRKIKKILDIPQEQNIHFRAHEDPGRLPINSLYSC